MRVRSRSKNAAPGLTESSVIDRRLGDPGLAAVDVDDYCVALPAAGADGRTALAPAAAAQLEHQRAEDARARRADRMANRHGPAIDVDLVLVDAEHADRVQRDRGERLVDLPQVDVIDAQPG